MFKIADTISSVFVQLVMNGRDLRVPLAPDEERPIVVGSTATADFQVTGPRVAPIQFHIERYGEAVCLIPAYGIADLCLNGISVLGPTRLEQHNLVEFAGVHIDVTILEAQDLSHSGNQRFPEGRPRREFLASYSIDLPGEGDPTQRAMCPVLAADESDEWPTTVLQRVTVESGASTHPQAEPIERDGRVATNEQRSALAEQTTRRLVPFRPIADLHADSDPAFTLNGTQIIPVYRPGASDSDEGGNALAGNSRSEYPQLPARREPERAADSVHLVPLRGAPRPQTVPPRHTVSGPVEVPIATHALGRRATPALGANTHRHAHPPSAPRRVSVGSGQPSWLARLGLLTKARPLLVGGCACVGACALMGLFLTTSRLTERRPIHSISQSAVTVATALNSLRPAQVNSGLSSVAPSKTIQGLPAQSPGSVRPSQDTDTPKTSAEARESKALY